MTWESWKRAMRKIPLIEIFALLSIFVAPAAHAQVDVALVEGHVFSKFTGVPLRGAVVEAFEIVASFPHSPVIPVASVVGTSASLTGLG
jgi:hypothetical protein